jgi:arylformamidase
MRLIDVTVGLHPDVPRFGNRPPAPSREPLRSIAAGDRSNSSRLSVGSHHGTHVDAPAHFIEGGATVDQLPLDALVGPAHVLAFPFQHDIRASDLAALDWPPHARRVLFKTRNSARWTEPAFYHDYVAVAPDAARWLVDRGIQLVGIDYLSIETYEPATPETHLALLGAGIVVLEGLDLRAVEPGPYTLLCLPLKFLGADGAPARTLLLAD